MQVKHKLPSPIACGHGGRNLQAKGAIGCDERSYQLGLVLSLIAVYIVLFTGWEDEE